MSDHTLADTSSVPCPYCGAGMYYKQLDHINGWYECPQCLSQGPAGRGKQDARKEALRRPMQEPLTLKDISGCLRVPCWIERKVKVGSDLTPDILDRDGSGFLDLRAEEYLLPSDYFVTWRCWLKYPTPEKREAAKWEVKRDD